MREQAGKLILLAPIMLVAALLAVVPIAAGSGGDREVIRSGECTGSSAWKLKLSFDNGRIETEFEVDQDRAGKRWRVVLRRNGRLSFRGIRTTGGPSGSFEVRRFLRNSAGPDRVVGRAQALATGEVCRGAATI